MINIYASEQDVSGSVLDKSVQEWKDNQYIDSDGSPIDLNKMSTILSKNLDNDKYYSFVYPKPDYSQSILNESEFNSSNYSVGIIKNEKEINGIVYTHYTSIKKENNITLSLDSLDSNRQGASDYKIITIEPMEKYTIPKK
ncbi:MAG: hypothetical protein MJ196_08595 [Treponemataceae bacterium]|nr:hypothetical protein [Treponemataceae bacterium]